MNLLFSFAFVICTLSCKAALQSSLEWSNVDQTRIDIQHIQEDNVSIRLSNNGTTVGCLFDVLKLSLQSSHLHDLLLAVIQVGTEATRTTVPMASFLPVNDDENVPQTSILKCALNEAHCVLNVENIVANTLGHPSIQVSFTHETNMPDLSSTFQLLEALVFTPNLLGAGIGEWLNSKTLVIMIDTVYLDVIMEGIFQRDSNIFL